MGEVISSRNDDGVFTGRESHTSHLNQMKLFNAITAAAIIGATSCIAATPAEARGAKGQGAELGAELHQQ